MGVGKSTVARHLARILNSEWIDLDDEIERVQGISIAEIVDSRGLDAFREIERSVLSDVVKASDSPILSLGGGTFAGEQNRIALSRSGITSIWLEAPFSHCWANISMSYKDRPLARDRKKAKGLFTERNRVYCLADWHFLIKPGSNSFDVAGDIADQVFGVKI